MLLLLLIFYTDLFLSYFDTVVWLQEGRLKNLLHQFPISGNFWDIWPDLE